MHHIKILLYLYTVVIKRKKNYNVIIFLQLLQFTITSFHPNFMCKNCIVENQILILNFELDGTVSYTKL